MLRFCKPCGPIRTFRLREYRQKGLGPVPPRYQRPQSKFHAIEQRLELLENKIQTVVEKPPESPVPVPAPVAPSQAIYFQHKPVVFEEDLVSDSAVRKILTDFEAFLHINGSRRDELRIRRLHTVLSGNSGVGKTTTARLLAVKLHAHGVITTPYVLKLTTEEICTFLETAPNLSALLEEYVLYIDQAEKAWEKYGMNFFNGFLNKLDEIKSGVVIFATSTGGYQKLANRSASFQQLFPFHYTLPNLKEEQLTEITESVLQRYAIKFDEKLEENFRTVLSTLSFADLQKKNGHIAVGLAQKAAFNLIKNSQTTVPEWAKVSLENFQDPLIAASFDVAEIDAMIGLPEVKEFLKLLYKRAKSEILKGPAAKSKFLKSLNMLFVGNAGTGKAEVASMISKMLYSLGFLKKQACNFAQVSDFSSLQKFKELFESSNGEVLAIQDISQLGHLDSGFFVTLSSILNGDHEVVLILTDTPRHIEKIFSANPGLSTFFHTRLHFKDFTANELYQLGLKFFSNERLILQADAEKELLHQINLSPMQALNATFVKQLVAQTKYRYDARVAVLAETSPRFYAVAPEDFKDEKSMMSAEEIFAELDALTGLKKVKNYVRDLYAQCLTNKERRARGISQGRDVDTMHMIFKGNAGTGKTTVALLIAKLFKSINLLSTGHIVHATRDDFISYSEGGVGQKVREVVSSAIGGVLLVDEAYSLAQEEHDFYGNMAITALVDLMEKQRQDLVVILAGYPKEMTKLLNMNPGLRSRIPHEIVFDDFSAEEQLKIATSIFEKQHYTLSEHARKKLQILFNSGAVDGNGRGIRHLVSKLIRNQNLRLSTNLNCDVEELVMVTDKDFADPHRETKPTEVLAKFERLTGLASVKEFVHSLYSRMLVANDRLAFAVDGANKLNSFHMVFEGNPGTGKTLVAKLMAQLLHSVNVIPTSQLMVAKRDDMVAKYLGQTEHRTRNLIQSALGGVLFIDEAYHLLIQDDFGKVALTVFLI